MYYLKLEQFFTKNKIKIGEQNTIKFELKTIKRLQQCMK